MRVVIRGATAASAWEVMPAVLAGLTAADAAPPTDDVDVVDARAGLGVDVHVRRVPVRLPAPGAPETGAAATGGARVPRKRQLSRLQQRCAVTQVR